jgi:BirA family transcriptional regulator, biotin operon repressor / biotin---[acetyl-CoA-carboxylase] ligase
MSASPYGDLDRPPLSPDTLRRALIVPQGLWTDLVVTPRTGSTNADALAAARAGAAEGLVIVAEQQTAGRGRMDRRWESPPRAGLTLSVLLRPASVPSGQRGWLPLLAGVALVETVRRLGSVDAVVKWPNDLLIDGRKCAGILAESTGDAIIIGIGLNVTMRADELPVPEATSLALVDAVCTDRDPLLRALLRGFADWYRAWREAAGDPDASGLRAVYRLHCATLGREVEVALPDGGRLAGLATDVDRVGRLLLTGEDGEPVAVAAGDVRHVR